MGAVHACSFRLEPSVSLLTSEMSHEFAVIGHSSWSSCALYFPVYAISVSECLALERFESHETLLERNSLLLWEESMGPLLFVSHQWLAFDPPDPDNTQLAALQAACHDLPGLLKDSQRDLYKGATNMTGITRQDQEVVDDPDKCWVWADYWSIPQIRSGTTQLQAIHRIP